MASCGEIWSGEAVEVCSGKAWIGTARLGGRGVVC